MKILLICTTMFGFNFAMAQLSSSNAQIFRDGRAIQKEIVLNEISGMSAKIHPEGFVVDYLSGKGRQVTKMNDHMVLGSADGSPKALAWVVRVVGREILLEKHSKNKKIANLTFRLSKEDLQGNPVGDFAQHYLLNTYDKVTDGEILTEGIAILEEHEVVSGEKFLHYEDLSQSEAFFLPKKIEKKKSLIQRLRDKRKARKMKK